MARDPQSEQEVAAAAGPKDPRPVPAKPSSAKPSAASDPMHQAARELMRAIRGHLPQTAFSRRLGYRGNPASDWEAGRRMPTADEMLRACQWVGIDAHAALMRFHAAMPPDLNDPQAVPRWLDELRGTTPINTLAARTGRSRFSISRFLSGESRPRVPDFLRLVDAITGRACDLVAELVPIEQVPSLAQAHADRLAARTLAHEEPWTELILRLLQTPAYRARPRHEPGCLARMLGIDPAAERRCLTRLVAAKIVIERDGRYELERDLLVNTRAAPELKAHWARVAAKRARTPGPSDVHCYSTFSVSSEDMRRIEQRLRATHREIMAIAAGSSGDDEVGLVNLQLVRVGDE